MMRWNPNSELANLHGAMDRLFDDFFGSTSGGGGNQRQVPTYLLPLDVRQVDEGYEIKAPVPGFRPEEVEVTFEEGLLKIEAQHAEQAAEDRAGYLRREVGYANYQRAIQLPGDVREDEITAAFEDGMLTVTVPKAPRPQPKKIKVTGSPRKQLAGTAS